MRKKIRPVWLWLLFLTLFLGLIFQSFPVKAQEQEELRLYSQSAVLMDGLSGRILYGKNAEQIRPMASTTKICPQAKNECSMLMLRALRSSGMGSASKMGLSSSSCRPPAAANRNMPAQKPAKGLRGNSRGRRQTGPARPR